MLHCQPLLRFVKFEFMLHFVDFSPNPNLSDFKINIHSKVRYFPLENHQAPLRALLLSESYDAEVVEFLPLFAFHAMKLDEEPAKLCAQSA